MKTAALSFVASLAAASAQDAYPQQLRGDRILSVATSAKAEKLAASSAKSSKAKSSKT
jgi:hypothetical protein